MSSDLFELLLLGRLWRREIVKQGAANLWWRAKLRPTSFPKADKKWVEA